MTVDDSNTGDGGRVFCGANKRQGEGTCTQTAGWGTDHVGIGRCKLHGGKTGTHNQHAQVEILRQTANRLGVSVDVDPGEGLIGLVREAAGNVEFYRSLVAELPIHPEDDTFDIGGGDEPGGWKRGDPGIYGRMHHVSGIPTGEAKRHILLVMYDDERDRFMNYCREALKAGVEERQLRLEESDARGLMAAVIQSMQAAKLTPEQSEVFRGEFAKYLRQVERPQLAGGSARPS